MISSIVFCQNKLDFDYSNVYACGSRAGNISAARSTILFTFSNLSWTRHNVCRVQRNIQDLMKCGYCVVAENGLELGFFVVSYTYISDNTTECHLKIDSWTNFFYDAISENPKAFIIRQSDSQATETSQCMYSPENIDPGEYKTHQGFEEYRFDNSVQIRVSYICKPDTFELYPGTVVDKVYDQVKYEYFPIASFASLNDILKQYNEAGQLSSIVDIMLVPQQTQSGNTKAQLPITKPTTVDGYVPKCKKLLRYPYIYCTLSNGDGQEVPYKYELMGGFAAFTVEFAGGSSPGVICYPTNYQAKTDECDEGLSVINFPHCAWSEQTYQTWLAGNANVIAAQQSQYNTTQGINIAKGVMGVVSALPGAMEHSGNTIKNIMKTGNEVGAIAAGGLQLLYEGIVKPGADAYMSYLSSKASYDVLMAGNEDRKLTPNALNGQKSTSINNLQWDRWRFRVRHYTIRNSRAKAIDNYFLSCGYNWQDFEEPKWTPDGETNSRFIQLADIRLKNVAPAECMAEIYSALKRGVTLWGS